MFPKIVEKNKKPWISTDILDMMGKRKRAKNTSYDDIAARWFLDLQMRHRQIYYQQDKWWWCVLHDKTSHGVPIQNVYHNFARQTSNAYRLNVALTTCRASSHPSYLQLSTYNQRQALSLPSVNFRTLWLNMKIIIQMLCHLLLETSTIPTWKRYCQNITSMLPVRLEATRFLTTAILQLKMRTVLCHDRTTIHRNGLWL